MKLYKITIQWTFANVIKRHIYKNKRKRLLNTQISMWTRNFFCIFEKWETCRNKKNIFVYKMGVSLFLFTVKAKKQKAIVIVNMQIYLEKEHFLNFRVADFIILNINSGNNMYSIAFH